MRFTAFVIASGIVLWLVVSAAGQEGESEPAVSEATEECIGCHAEITPGIVGDWQKSRHARITPGEALKKGELEKRISAKEVPEELLNTVVGCAECHSLNPEKHKDTFEHNDRKIHTVVSPQDCATCHPEEMRQYGNNKMAHAYGNLKNNPVYMDLANSINGVQVFRDGKLETRPVDDLTEADSCLSCHGTKVEVKGIEERETDLGEMEFPVLSGWPNQGTGRINPDGSLGSCSSCHARHQFSIEMARKPETCSQCHKGPDVPAYKVYKVSKHGNIYSSVSKEWDFEAVPWKVGKDFTAPTCAVCHVSLVTDGEGKVVAKRTHQMSDRLSQRLLGIIYSHPQPKSPDTTKIKNKAGLPLPTELTGEPAGDFLIDNAEQSKREETIKGVCLSCHVKQWVDGHFKRLNNTIKKTDEMVLTSTQVLMKAWEKGAASGLSQNDSIFNEAIEKKWVEQWLFYANSTRLAAAMAGTDYGVFAQGRWHLSKNLREMSDWLEFKLGASDEGKKK